MLTLTDTSLETFSFGSAEEDTYYILVNLTLNPDGINIQKLAQTDPRYFDTILNEMGCILMLSGTEINELALRRELDKESLHNSVFDLAKRENIIK